MPRIAFGCRLSLGWIMIGSLVACAANARAAEPAISYNRDVRPILMDNCFACHGADSAARKADLRLDKREAAMEAAAIEPGKPDESELIARITSSDPKKMMPPPAAKKTLTAEQKATLKSWIAAGAEYQPHWSLIAPQRAPLPEIKDNAWVKNPIDNFILAKLEERGLEPSPEADRRTLARRACLDITGLPPSPDMVAAFVDDKSPDAFEKLLDKLFLSPHYGEHRAKYWLDAARYADTNGIHFDNFREMWSYREWVINAFNHNMPFDQFTTEQLAGDLLPNRTVEQQIATGFNRCHTTTNEGGAIAEEYLVHYTRDRTETAAIVFMGVSANCMTCHDHKFDPFLQKEFYSLAAFFNNTTQGAMDGNVKNQPPVMPVIKAEDRPRFDSLQEEAAAARKALEDRKTAAKPEYEKWLASAPVEDHATAEPSREGLKFFAPLTEGEGNKLTLTIDGKPKEVKLKQQVHWEPAKAASKAFKSQPGAIAVSEAGDFEQDQPFTAAAWINVSNLKENGAIVARMDDPNDHRGWDLWFQAGHIGSHVIHKWPSDALKVVSKATIKENEWTHVSVAYDGTRTVAGTKIYIDGALQETMVESDSLRNTIKNKVPLKIGMRNSASGLADLTIHDVRIYDRALPPHEIEALAKSSRIGTLLAIPAEKRSELEQNEILQWWLQSQDRPYIELSTKVTALEKERVAIQTRGTIAHVMQEKNDMPKAFVLYRGEYDQRKDEVKPGTPKALPPMPDDFPRNRLGLARWLLLPEHPLTARVTVNRFWQELFGTGIVKTTNDLGVAGELPSHQELLDWLAVEFRESGWNVQHIFKLMLLSSAYRQSAATTPEKLEKDPANRLLSRGPRFRMEAEMIRDYALAASGLLVDKIGGPSVRPYQPDGIWEVVGMGGSDTRNYKRDTGEGLYRRSLYSFWKRMAPPASLEIFNAPNRETCTVRRDRTNTPLQALVTLNDPQYVEAARNFAQTALKEGGEKDADKFDFIAQRLLARPFRAEEVRVVQGSLDKLLAYYKAQPEEAKKLIAVGESKADAALEPAQLAGWTMLVNELMNLDEVLNK